MAQLGDLVKDEITGFEGVVLAKLEQLYDATECRIQPTSLTESGRSQEPEWFAEDRLIVSQQNFVVGFRQIAGKEILASKALETAS